MSARFLGQIGLFSFPFAPQGWAFCQGQILSISQNTALYSLLGTQYGGDGRSTFALPNLQSSQIVGFGQGSGLANYVQGQAGGSATVSLNANQIPAHTHTLPASTARGTLSQPASGSGLAATVRGTYPYAPSANGSMAGPAVVATGGGQPHNNMMPYLSLNYCISLVGIFPSRP